LVFFLFEKLLLLLILFAIFILERGNILKLLKATLDESGTAIRGNHNNIVVTYSSGLLRGA
jgi:hypothetical protein